MEVGNETIEARWAKDSETGEEVLLELKTGKVLARKNREGKIIQ